MTTRKANTGTMKHLYYVTSKTTKRKSALLRWFRRGEARQTPLVSAAEAFTDSQADPNLQPYLDELLSADEARGVAQCLQGTGHYTVKIHRIALPMAVQELLDLLALKGTPYDHCIYATASGDVFDGYFEVAAEEPTR